MRSLIAGLTCVLALSRARAQARPSDSAAVILVVSDSTATSLGGKVAVATRAALIRLRDPKLSVVPDPFVSLASVGPPVALSLRDILELGRSWGAAIIIEVIATPQQSGWVHVTASLVRRESPPFLIATIDAADIAAAVDPLAEHIASDGEVLAQFVVDSSGRVDPATFKVLKSTAPAFTRAVQAFVGEMTFTPAEFRGRRVNQLVQMPFQFP